MIKDENNFHFEGGVYFVLRVFSDIMKLFLLAIILNVFFSFSEVYAAEKVGQPLLCHGCVAVLKELHKVLKDSSGRKQTVTRSLGNLCKLDNFVSYTFSPPKMIKACNYIVENHRDELAENLIQFYRKFKVDDNLPLQEKFCDDVIKACKGVRRPVKDSEMKPHGFSAEEVNQKIQNIDQKDFSSQESNSKTVLEKPIDATIAPSHEEL